MWSLERAIGGSIRKCGEWWKGGRVVVVGKRAGPFPLALPACKPLRTWLRPFPAGGQDRRCAPPPRPSISQSISLSLSIPCSLRQKNKRPSQTQRGREGKEKKQNASQVSHWRLRLRERQRQQGGWGWNPTEEGRV